MDLAQRGRGIPGASGAVTGRVGPCRVGVAFGGWGIGVIVHGLAAYEIVRFLGPKWERAIIERRLGRKL